MQCNARGTQDGVWVIFENEKKAKRSTGERETPTASPSSRPRERAGPLGAPLSENRTNSAYHVIV